jgi:mannose-6-phosphate isomerase-like protein (cupin superfamily)
MTFAPGMIALGPADGQRLEAMGNLHINKAVGVNTNGAWALVEQHINGANPPLHQHDREDEAWYVLRGRARVWIGDAEIEAEPGSFVLAPRGVPHTFARQPDGDPPPAAAPGSREDRVPSGRPVPPERELV